MPNPAHGTPRYGVKPDRPSRANLARGVLAQNSATSRRTLSAGLAKVRDEGVHGLFEEAPAGVEFGDDGAPSGVHHVVLVLSPCSTGPLRPRGWHVERTSRLDTSRETLPRMRSEPYTNGDPSGLRRSAGAYPALPRREGQRPTAKARARGGAPRPLQEPACIGCEFSHEPRPSGSFPGTSARAREESGPPVSAAASDGRFESTMSTRPWSSSGNGVKRSPFVKVYTLRRARCPPGSSSRHGRLEPTARWRARSRRAAPSRSAARQPPFQSHLHQHRSRAQLGLRQDGSGQVRGEPARAEDAARRGPSNAADDSLAAPPRPVNPNPERHSSTGSRRRSRNDLRRK